MAPAPRKSAKKNEGEEPVGPSKEQDEIARYIRFNCPTSTTLFQGNEVHYFSGNKAVDTLINSKYGEKAKGEKKFADRNAATTYIQELMDLQMFWRAKKLVQKKKDDKKKKDGDVTETDQEEKKDESKKDTKADEKEKKKKKVKLEIHPTQVFNDDKDVYVWVFDPTPLYKKIIGLLMVVGTIVGCLFPLWPMWLRQGVWYLSLVGLGAFAAILITAILRTILFGIIWLATMGQHKLWILPNLTEDCGFFESFKPWYTYEYCPRGGKQEDKEKDKKDKKKKEKDSDAEEGDEEEKKPLLEKKKDAGDAGEESTASVSDDNASQENSADSGSEMSAPPSPSSESTQLKKRRARRADDGFVHVK